MRYALAATIVLATNAAGHTAPDAQRLIKAWREANGHCRSGPSDQPSVDAECERRSRLDGRLSQIGWCYGMKGQAGADYEWHRCGPRSLQTDDLSQERLPGLN